MALSREEISIRLGVNGAAISPGLAAVRQKINQFTNDVGKKMYSMLKANLFLAGAQLLQDFLPTAKEFWQNYYGISDEIIEMSEKSHSRMKQFVKNIQSARDAVAKKREAAQFDAADRLGKEAILEAAIVFAQRDRLDLAKKLKATALDDIDAREEILIAIENANLVEIDSAEKLKKIRAEMNVGELNSSTLRRLDRVKEVFQLRTDIKSLKDEMKFSEESGDLGKAAELHGEIKAKTGRIGEIIDERQSIVNDRFKPLADALPSFGPFKLMQDFMRGGGQKSGADMARESSIAFAKELANQKLKVSIVEIKE